MIGLITELQGRIHSTSLKPPFRTFSVFQIVLFERTFHILPEKEGRA